MLNNLTCPWCGRHMGYNYNREHVVPRSMGGRKGWNIMRAHPYCNKLRGSEFYVPSPNYDYKLYRYFTDIQMLYLIRTTYLHRDELKWHFEWRIKYDNYIFQEHYKIQLDNLNNIITLVDNKVIDVFNYKFNET